MAQKLTRDTGGCSAGDICHFVHDENRLPGSIVKDVSQVTGVAEASGSSQMEDGDSQAHGQAVIEPVPASRVVSKPIPKAQAQDPREFQLGQVRRRFHPKERKGQNNAATLLDLSVAPSDPDFAFEMTALECTLSVPMSYPKDKATLQVRNQEIPRGFALNIEAGFQSLILEKPSTTLLDLLKALDKNLETFLSAPKAETITLVPNKDTRHLSNLPSRSVTSSISIHKSQVSAQQPGPAISHAAAPQEPVRSFTKAEKDEAAKKREGEIRQLEARMGRLPFWKKSSDNIAFTVQIEPKKRSDLPLSIQAVKTVHLYVPLLYPLEPCRVRLDGNDSDDSKAVSAGFLKKSSQQSTFSLTAYLNFLAQNMHILAKTPLEPKELPSQAQLAPPPTAVVVPEVKGKGVEGVQDPERSHVQYISRPPEWDVIDYEDISDTESGGVYSYDSYDSSDGGADVRLKDDDPDANDGAAEPMQNQERGTAISFPFVELYGIELLEIVTLNITVKCDRCRDITEIKGLKNGVAKSESCKKCASSLVVCFRRDFVHANAVRAGFLDLEGCVVGDMLPRYACSTHHML